MTMTAIMNAIRPKRKAAQGEKQAKKAVSKKSKKAAKMLSKKPRKNIKAAVLMPRKNVLGLIEKKVTDPRARRICLAWMQKNVPLRSGSPSFAKAHPSRAMSEEMKEIITYCCCCNLSFRAAETVFRLIPAKGNTAQRIVDYVLGIKRGQGLATTKEETAKRAASFLRKFAKKTAKQHKRHVPAAKVASAVTAPAPAAHVVIAPPATAPAAAN